VNLSPRTHLLYCFLVAALIEVTGQIGSGTLRRAVVRTLGATAFRFSSGKRRGARSGVNRFFTDSLPGQDQIVWESFQFFWEELFWLLPTREERRLAQDATVHGLEHLESALKEGKGAILLESNSFGYRSGAKQVLSRKGHSLIQVHAENHLGGLRNRAPASSPFRLKIRNVFEAWECQFIDEFVYLPSEPNLAYGRRLRQFLASNRIICSAGDGDWGERHLSLSFLGGIRRFPTGMVSLSRATGAPIIPLIAVREPEGNLKVVLEAPLRIKPESGREEATREGLTEFAAVLERWISSYPGLYRNWQSLAQAQVRSPKTPQ